MNHNEIMLVVHNITPIPPGKSSFEVVPITKIITGIGFHIDSRKIKRCQPHPKLVKKWQEDGYFESPSYSKPGVIKKIGWGYAEDLKKYDLLIVANKLTMPVFLAVGENDYGTPYAQQKKFLDKIPHENKKLILVSGVDHNYRAPDGNYEKLPKLKESLSSWLKENT